MINLIPIPPLDGHHLLFAFLPERFDEFKKKLYLYGSVILLSLVLIDSLTRVSLLSGFLRFVTAFIQKIIF
ncbi:MAG: hypothetical protein HYW78_03650 [Parcubacteria group bacterium]|nr:hypothetical protein [Parcubacteria group bacterium]